MGATAVDGEIFIIMFYGTCITETKCDDTKMDIQETYKLHNWEEHNTVLKEADNLSEHVFEEPADKEETYDTALLKSDEFLHQIEWEANYLAENILALFKDFKDEDFREDGSIKASSIRLALNNKNIPTELINKAMPIIFKKIEEHS